LAWGRGEPVGLSMAEMAARYVKEMRRVQPHGPYYLSGYCLFGIVALEMAHQLRSQGEEVAALFPVDSNYDPGIIKSPLEKAVHMAHRLRFYFLKKPRALKEILRRKVILQRLRRELPLPELAIVNRVFFLEQVARPYRSPKYDGRVVLLCAANPQYPHPFGIRKDGWDRILTGEVFREDIACNHDEIVREPFTKEVARRMELHMSRLDAERRIAT
jgi:oxalate---CoA ligase